jgi:hypothetical protein
MLSAGSINFGIGKEICMSEFMKNGALMALISLMLITSACGSQVQNESAISTAVAQTVEAGDSLTEITSLPTLTSIPSAESTTTLEPNPIETTAPIPAPGCTLSAILIDENPPDGTLLMPGKNFWKTWTLKNTGTCTWDGSYKLMYWSGDLMGGLNSYPFPDVIAPDESKDVSIYLKAPETTGTFTGYWRIQTPWGADFGVGPTSESFYAQISVSNDAAYGVASVTYDLVRNPAIGCPANVRFTVTATITTNGPYEFNYRWVQSDGNNSGIKTLKYTQAESKTFVREWMIGRGDSPNPRWMMIVVTEPNFQEYGKVEILNTCP